MTTFNTLVLKTVSRGFVYVGVSVSRETEKAIQFCLDNGETVWFPKVAIKPYKKDIFNGDDTVKLAHWFDLSMTQDAVLQKNLRMARIEGAGEGVYVIDSAI